MHKVHTTARIHRISTKHTVCSTPSAQVQHSPNRFRGFFLPPLLFSPLLFSSPYTAGMVLYKLCHVIHALVVGDPDRVARVVLLHLRPIERARERMEREWRENGGDGGVGRRARWAMGARRGGEEGATRSGARSGSREKDASGGVQQEVCSPHTRMAK